MLVHLAGNLRNLEVDPPVFYTIVQAIHDQGSMLALSWVEPMIRILQDGDVANLDWNKIVAENIAAIKRADVVIIEATTYSFSQGFQLAAALEYKKPTILLFKNTITKSSVTGFDNPLFTHAIYKDSVDLGKVVETFLRKNTIATKDLRFNFFMDRKINKYLQDVVRKTGKNKSEIIRDVIKHKIEEQSHND